MTISHLKPKQDEESSDVLPESKMVEIAQEIEENEKLWSKHDKFIKSVIAEGLMIEDVYDNSAN